MSCPTLFNDDSNCTCDDCDDVSLYEYIVGKIKTLYANIELFIVERRIIRHRIEKDKKDKAIRNSFRGRFGMRDVIGEIIFICDCGNEVGGTYLKEFGIWFQCSKCGRIFKDKVWQEVGNKKYNKEFNEVLL